jgi:NAD(P)H-flavin reductase
MSLPVQGQCPKYITKKKIVPASVSSKLLSDSPQLTPAAIELIGKTDLFFISSSHHDDDMDTNNRGGPPGFVRVLSNDESGAELVYPEYSGNRLYQTLGNLQVNPKAGLVFPDFETGDVLYVTGNTETLIGEEANELLPHSNLAIKIKLTGARFVEKGLPFRGITEEFSPYNPNVWLLAKEGSTANEIGKVTSNSARLVKKTRLTPTITRYRFETTQPAQFEAGQWVAMDFSHELNLGYSHMRDDDPKSLNDDYIRTFTVSSYPSSPHDANKCEFEITVRRAGPVTAFLERSPESDHVNNVEVPLRGFGGDFKIRASNDEKYIPFIAGGIGITPLLGQLPDVPLDRLQLFWTVRFDDLMLVVDTLSKFPQLGPVTRLFVTGPAKGNIRSEHASNLATIKETGAQVIQRRMLEDDLSVITAKKWYLCAGKQLRNILLHWLKDHETIYEDFNY